MESLLVVGDKFGKFSQDKENVITFDDFERLAWRDGLRPECDIWLGQGIEHDRLFGVLALLDKRHSRKGYRIVNLQQMLDQADPSHQATVHKARRENVLITRPQQVAEARYESWLALQDSGELLGDHMTGQHVQGMLLIEAARQMMLSVSETYLLGEKTGARYYFVLNSVNTEYLQFAFPLPTLLSHEILTRQLGKGGSVKVTCQTSFYQGDTLTARVLIQYGAYVEDHISEKEAKLARDAYERHINEHDMRASAG
jgi:hypothetical protein